MKLAFTTLGCPDWPFEQMLEQAQQMGFQGIELRGIEGVMRAEQMAIFQPQAQAETSRKLRERGLRIICLDTSCRFDTAEGIPEALEEGRAAIDICGQMGIPGIRIFGDSFPEGVDRAQTMAQITVGARALADHAAPHGVEVWIETHGDITSAALLGELMEKVNRPNFGILWDIEHTDKRYGDDFDLFYKPLHPHIRHLHIKDHTRLPDGTWQLALPGEGDIPIHAIVRRLREDGYRGFYSLEWEKKWHPELQSPEIAFPAYVRTMRDIR